MPYLLKVLFLEEEKTKRFQGTAIEMLYLLKVFIHMLNDNLYTSYAIVNFLTNMEFGFSQL